jgi:hypothetical protein
MRTIALPLLVLALASRQARAQEPTSTPRAAEQTPHVSPAVGIHFGTPLRTSLSAGVMLDVSQKRNDGMIVMLEAGQGGNEVSAGYFRMWGKYGSGFSVRGAVVRTGDHPWNGSEHTTYVGVEGYWMLLFGVGGRVGYLRRASRSEVDPHNGLATAGVSIGW